MKMKSQHVRAAATRSGAIGITSMLKRRGREDGKETKRPGHPSEDFCICWFSQGLEFGWRAASDELSCVCVRENHFITCDLQREDRSFPPQSLTLKHLKEICRNCVMGIDCCSVRMSKVVTVPRGWMCAL